MAKALDSTIFLIKENRRLQYVTLKAAILDWIPWCSSTFALCFPSHDKLDVGTLLVERVTQSTKEQDSEIQKVNKHAEFKRALHLYVGDLGK